DQLHLQPLKEQSDLESKPAQNQVSARITAIEFTGYITRVTLALEKTGVEVLYKARTTDWMLQPLHEGQVALLDWSAQNCVFLAH
ncbi:MAG: TOBE domain-containing protein, partial [Cyanobacteria bacterium J06659_2]